MSKLREQSRALRPGVWPAALRSAWPAALGAVLAFLAQHYATHFVSDFQAKVLLDVGINIVLAVSLTIVNGFTGQFSIGHGAFMAVGGYSAAAIVYYGSMLTYGDANVHGGLISMMLTGREAAWVTPADGLFAAALLIGGLAAGVCGYLVGLPSLRLKGDYLAIVTLGFGEIVRVLFQQTTDVLYTPEDVRATSWYLLPTKVGGALGFSGLPFYTSLFWVYLFASIMLIVAYRLKYSTYGRAFLSIREDEIAAEAMGVNTTRYKVWAFVIAAFFAGIGGGLFAHTVGVQLNPQELGFQKSFDIIIMVVLGGLGSISGAAIAAVIVTILPEVLRDPTPFLRLWPILLVVAAVGWAAWGALRHRVRPLAGALLGIASIATVLLALAFVAERLIAGGKNPGDYRMIVFALALIVMMIARPQGLFGVRELWERALWRNVDRRRGFPVRRVGRGT
ncbi:MAG: branched-chain amino acid ABC transporter permease [Phycisphaerae bacterium]